MSKTRESQLAVTTASGQRGQALAVEPGSGPGGGLAHRMGDLRRGYERLHVQAPENRLVRPQVGYCNASAATRGSFQPHECAGPGRRAGAPRLATSSPGCRPGWPGPTSRPERDRLPVLHHQCPDLPSSPRAAEAELLGVLASRSRRSPTACRRAVAVEPSGSGRAGAPASGRLTPDGARKHWDRRARGRGRAGIVFDHGQHDGGAADLEEGGDLRRGWRRRRSRGGDGSAWGRRAARRASDDRAASGSSPVPTISSKNSARCESQVLARCPHRAPASPCRPCPSR